MNPIALRLHEAALTLEGQGMPEIVAAFEIAEREILRLEEELIKRPPKKIDTTEVSGRTPTHRCKVCGALWILYPTGDRYTPDGSWSLCSRECGPCCDNVAMGDQIEALPADTAGESRGD